MHRGCSIVMASLFLKWGSGSRQPVDTCARPCLQCLSLGPQIHTMLVSHGLDFWQEWTIFVVSKTPLGEGCYGSDFHMHSSDLTPYLTIVYIQFSSVTQPCPTLCDPMDRSTPGLPVYHQLLEFTLTHLHWVGDAIQPSLCHPLLLLPSIFPSISVFSNKSALHIRWPLTNISKINQSQRNINQCLLLCKPFSLGHNLLCNNI